MTVKELLTGPEKWTKGWSARKADGDECNSTMDGAVCWCIWGGIKTCYPDDPYTVAHRVEAHVGIGGDRLTHWNDAPERTFEEVKQVVEELNI